MLNISSVTIKHASRKTPIGLAVIGETKLVMCKKRGTPLKTLAYQFFKKIDKKNDLSHDINDSIINSSKKI